MPLSIPSMSVGSWIWSPHGATTGSFVSFLDALVLPEQDAIFNAGVDLPTVFRMGFSYVDEEEFHVFFVLVVNLVHAPDLSAEGGSSVAAEGQRYRAITLEAGKVDALILAHRI